ncbi:hypothetical protein ROZALSC1DRAFT_26069 [Rozella allomycis CSF55]|uniref:Uncharacterized protein n=1 Tax=Rozella allomycis (strain CSF55) TaxID=988480 RepID=A0A4P9YAB1_ROZAC|nr:hypothetical protein ROZALSC1DRAFT_26069 [Rozella allomycis CSF55]
MINGGNEKLVLLLKTLLEAYYYGKSSITKNIERTVLHGALSKGIIAVSSLANSLVTMIIAEPLFYKALEKCFQKTGVYDFRTHSLKSVLESISATSGGEFFDYVLPFRLLSQNINEMPLKTFVYPIQEKEFVIKYTTSWPPQNVKNNVVFIHGKTINCSIDEIAKFLIDNEDFYRDLVVVVIPKNNDGANCFMFWYSHEWNVVQIQNKLYQEPLDKTATGNAINSLIKSKKILSQFNFKIISIVAAWPSL